MSGSPLASAPPITVTQENGASATVPTPNQTPTYPRTGPTEGARAHCPARMQNQKKKGEPHARSANARPSADALHRNADQDHRDRASANRFLHRQTRNRRQQRRPNAKRFARATRLFGRAQSECRSSAKDRTERRVPGDQLVCQTAHPIHFHRRVPGRKKRRNPQSRYWQSTRLFGQARQNNRSIDLEMRSEKRARAGTTTCQAAHSILRLRYELSRLAAQGADPETAAHATRLLRWATAWQQRRIARTIARIGTAKPSKQQDDPGSLSTPPLND